MVSKKAGIGAALLVAVLIAPLSLPTARTRLYSFYAHAALLMGISTNAHIVVGKEHWLFESADRDEYSGTVQPDAAALGRWQRTYLQRLSFTNRLSAHYLFVITPLKQVANSNLLPDTWRRTGTVTRVKLFKSAVGRSNMDILDLSSAMILRREKGAQIWYKYDTHMNWVGAMTAVEAIVNHLHSHYPAISKFDRNQYSIIPAGPQLRFGLYILNLAEQLGIHNLREPDYAVEKRGGWTTNEKVMHDGWMTIYTYTKDAPSLPTLVMSGDSNIFPMRRFLAEYFKRSVFINPWEAKYWQLSQFPANWIEAESPDIVIDMRTEAGLLGAAANPPDLARD